MLLWKSSGLGQALLAEFAEDFEDLSCNDSLEASDRLHFAHSFLSAPFHVGPGPFIVPQPDDDYLVQGAGSLGPGCQTSWYPGTTYPLHQEMCAHLGLSGRYN